jgi:hypothetical protein
MSNLSKEHPSIRVHAPPGGHSSNIFGTEFEQSAANKKKHMESDIFGSKKDNVDPVPVKQTHNKGSNIFGTDPEEIHTKPTTLAGQYKQTQMKSNIFGTDEPTSARHVSDKNKSDIFGTSGNDDQNKRQTGGIRRDPNASRMGYNPINGESYTIKDNVNSKNIENEKQPDSTVKPAEEENSNVQAAAPINTTENVNAQVTPGNTTENGNIQVPPATNTQNVNAQKPVEKPDNAVNVQKNVHTSVRVFQPPGGKSTNPLW